MKTVYGYTRVSTLKQGEHGVSLQEQRSAIEEYCARNDLTVVEWFEERVTAAKRGRLIFGKMLRKLRSGDAQGVVIHKIDRSARNLRDWADLGQLTDAGVNIYFANEGLDLSTRGGRLSADLQAVIAADFIRNLREEAMKGMYGRLKQGYFPFSAPVGYLNNGKGHPKTIDPVRGHLVVQLFEMYATGQYSLKDMVVKAREIGLKTKSGQALSFMTVSKILNNPFYYGVMRLKSTGEHFQGNHEPLISYSLFERCQTILHDRRVAKPYIHNYTYRRLFKCKDCGYSLIGEKQKGRIYYRCHTKGCPTKSINEEMITAEVESFLQSLRLIDEAEPVIRKLVDKELKTVQNANKIELAQNKKKLIESEIKLARLTDLLVDGDIDKETYRERKLQYLNEKLQLEESVSASTRMNLQFKAKIDEFLEQHIGLYARYLSKDLYEKRKILNLTTSNRTVSRKYIEIEPKEPFDQIAEEAALYFSAPATDAPRTLEKVSRVIVESLVSTKCLQDSFQYSSSLDQQDNKLETL
ncbi:MAG: recombinase family protein [Pseudomonadota bacterium]